MELLFIPEIVRFTMLSRAFKKPTASSQQHTAYGSVDLKTLKQESSTCMGVGVFSVDLKIQSFWDQIFSPVIMKASSIVQLIW